VQTIVADVSVCLSVMRLHLALAYKNAEWIEVLFGVKTLGVPRNIVLDRGPDPPTGRGRGSTFDAVFAKLLWPFVRCKIQTDA